MSSILVFDPITLPVPRDKVYSRMGYVRGTTSCSQARQKEIDQAIDSAAVLCGLKGCALRLPVKEMTARSLALPSGIIFESADLARMLAGCGEVVVMAATAGAEISEAIARSSSSEDLFRGVVYDAAASEMVEAAVQWIMDYFNRQLRREGKHCLPRRFSAGYGDFILENQRTIYDLLDLKRLGIELSPGLVLVPEKSVTALTGIASPEGAL